MRRASDPTRTGFPGGAARLPFGGRAPVTRRINRREFLRQAAASGALLGTPATAIARRGQHTRTAAGIDPAAVRAFASRLRGRAILPGEPGYLDACADWAGQVRLRPGLVVHCAAASDVSAAVIFARAHDLPLAVRNGGHAFRSTDGGVLVNLAGMTRAAVDAGRRVARTEAGLLLGDLDAMTAPHGLAAVLGECPSVGLSGYTLGGGLGRLMGQYGTASDNLLAAELVTADGRLLRASADEHADLFWAIRGGGGNFGIATAFEHRLHPVGQVLAGTIEYPIGQARTVLRFFREYMRSAPDTLDALLELGTVLQYSPHTTDPIVLVNVCCGGDARAAERTLRPLRSHGAPALDSIRPMSYFEAQTLGANLTRLRAHLTPRYSRAGRNGFVAQLADEAIDAVVAHSERPPSPHWSVAFDHYLHGEVCRVSEDATAFPLRQPGLSFRLVAFEEGAGAAERVTAWVTELHRTLDRFSGGRMYLNYLTDQGPAGVRASLGRNYERLAALKARFDPTNLFRLNPNITPGRPAA